MDDFTSGFQKLQANNFPVLYRSTFAHPINFNGSFVFKTFNYRLIRKKFISTDILKYYLLILTIFTPIQSYSQPKTVDSLLQELNSNQNDKDRVDTYISLAIGFFKYSPPAIDSVLKYANLAQPLAQKLKYKKQLAEVFLLQSNIYRERKDLEKAIEYCDMSREILEEINDRNGLARLYHHLGNIENDRKRFAEAEIAYSKQLRLNEELRVGDEIMVVAFNNMGFISMYQGKFNQAIHFFYKSLKAYENLNRPIDIALCYYDIGNVYNDQDDLENALYHYSKSVEIFQNLQDSLGLAKVYPAIGSIYRRQEKLDSALQYQLVALSLYKKYEYKQGVAGISSNIGSIYADRKDFNGAIKYFTESLEIFKQLDDKEGIALAYLNMGSAYNNLIEYDQANYFLNSALKQAEDIKNLILIRDIKESLSTTYWKQGKNKEAYETFVSYTNIKDSLFTVDKVKEIEKIRANYEFEKLQREKAEDAKIIIEARAQNNFFLFLLSGALGIIIFITVVTTLISRNLKRTKRDKSKIERLQKDIHHRMKTSLGTVGSLITGLERKVRQGAFTKDELVQYIKCLGERIARIGSLHRHLYVHDVTQIQFDSYIREMITDIDRIYGEKLNISFAINTPISLGLEIGTPLVLIINELITNSYRHAFLKKHSGEIIIDMVQESDDLFLSISDNGIGFPNSELPQRTSGLGIIQDFAEQLKAKINFESKNGVHFKLRMKNTDLP